MRVLLVSFADGSSDWVSALTRLESQAIESGLFAGTVCLTTSSYIAKRASFREDLKQISKLDVGPLAYRAVKAWLIRDALRGDFGSYDLVFYLDAGCELNINTVSSLRLRRKFRRAFHTGGLAELLAERENKRTKKELLDYLETGSDLTRTRQVQATWTMWRTSSENAELAQQWVDLSNPSLGLWQNPKVEAGDEHHRRDQSIMSILWKRAGLKTTEVECHFDVGTALGRLRREAIPILTSRNRGGITQVLGQEISLAWRLAGWFIHISGMAFTTAVNRVKFLNWQLLNPWRD